MTDRKEASTLSDAEIDALAIEHWGASLPSIRNFARALESRLAVGGSPLGRDDFIAGYIARSGVMRDFYDEHYVALPCDCGDKSCVGWVSIRRTPDQILDHIGTDLDVAWTRLAVGHESLPLDLHHEPADLAEAKEMLQRARLAVGQPVAPHHWLVLDNWFPSESVVLCTDAKVASAMSNLVHDNLPIKSRYTVTPYYAHPENAHDAAPDRPQEPQGDLAQECKRLIAGTCIMSDDTSHQIGVLIDRLAALPQECATVLMELVAAVEADNELRAANIMQGLRGGIQPIKDSANRILAAMAAARALRDRLKGEKT